MSSCRCCGRDELLPLWVDVDGNSWSRCGGCGSDTSSFQFTADIYDPHYYATHHGCENDPAFLEKQLESNISWFMAHQAKQVNPGSAFVVHRGAHGKTFLDVGCAEGTAMRMMAREGWSVHGFDISEEARRLNPPGKHITVHPWFHAGLFPIQYTDVLCREVLEHVEWPRQFLFDLARVTVRGGLLQIQTPRPATSNNSIGYQKAHLHLYSPTLLRWELERLGLRVLDYREWDVGQAYLCRKVDG